MTLIELLLFGIPATIGLALIVFVQKRFEANRPKYIVEATIMSLTALIAGAVMFIGIFYSFGVFEGRPNKLLFALEIGVYMGGFLCLACAALYLLKWLIDIFFDFLLRFKS
ncbi:hypothetical protein N9W89_06010 [Hellea sp.]|nr:hypothetical protein [Hellea sp.]